MGRPPKQKQVKEYLVNPKTRFLFSDAAEFREVFPKGEDHIYLTRAEGGKRLGKGTFRIVGHLPQKHNQSRDKYEQEKSGGSMSRFLRGGPLEASRMRYDAGSYPGFHLIVHTQDGKRQEFYLTSESRYGKGSLVYGTVTIPSKKTRQLVVCPVRLGHFGVSASKPGEFKLSLQKPKTMCGVSFIKAGHVGEETGKKWDEGSQSVKAAESGDIYISEAESSYFYAAQGIDLLSVQDVEVSESENQVRAWSNPADAMTGNETLEGYETVDSVNVDLSSNQPTMNLGAEGDVAAPDYDPEDYSVVTNPNAYDPEAMPDQFAAEAIPVAEGTSLTGYEPVDSVLEEAPIGHGVTQNFGADGEPLLEESTTNITIEEGVSLADFNGIDSVVVEPPLGHGVAQWYAESVGEGSDCPTPSCDGILLLNDPEPEYHCYDCSTAFGEDGEIIDTFSADGPLPPEPEGITGQDGPSADPTNEHMVRAAEMTDAVRKKIMKKYGRKAFVYPDTLGWPIMNLEGTDSQAKTALTFITWPRFKSKAKAVRKAVHKQFPSLAAESFEALGEPGASYDQGYDDQEDESLGMRHRGGHEQSFHDRRDEAAGMERHGGRRKYSNVGTMDLSAENLSRGSKSSFWRGKGGHLYALNNKGEIITHNAESAFDKLEDTIEEQYLEKGYSPERAEKIAGGAAYNIGVRAHGGGKKGKAWMRRAAKRGMKAEAGYIGDMTLEGYQPMDSIEVDRSSYQPTQDYGADFKLEKPVTTGFMLSLGAFCFAGAATLATVLLGSLLMRDE